MSFKNPEILYAFFLLLIPIIIHLVRWKKFKNELFTNVEFLIELEIKSRKSRKLKELLVLLLRLLAFAMLIFAFAKPYYQSKATDSNIYQSQTIIYADNSLSMSSITQNANLWQEVVQDFVRNIKNDNKYTLFTNDNTYKNIIGKKLKKLLYSIKFSSKNTNHSQVLKKAKLLFDKDAIKQKNFVYISDMQNVNDEIVTDSLFDNTINYHIYNKSIKKRSNISIDSIYLIERVDNYYKLKLKVSANNNELQSPISILQDKKLLWRGYANFKDSITQVFDIQIPFSNNLEAEIVVNDKGFQFDNSLFFSIQKPEVSNVLLLTTQPAKYLNRLFSDDSFVLDINKPNKIDYAKLSSYSLIIINEIEELNRISYDAFKKYVENYGNLVIIPNYQKPENILPLLKGLNIHANIELDTTKVLLNAINYNHKLFKNAFLKKTKNFSYPFVKNHLKFNAKNHNWLYQLSDFSPFVQQFNRNGKIFVFNAGINKNNSNFTEALSMYVTLFYQIGKINNKKDNLYFILGADNQWNVPAKLKKDEVIKLVNHKEDITPYQINQYNSVLIHTTDLPSNSGIYKVKLNDSIISSVAYNINRKENSTNIITFPKLKNISTINSFEEYNQQQDTFFKEQHIWKYFLAFALLFLLLEMLVIKYWK